MKKIALLLLSVSIFATSCSKKEYATFQPTHSPAYASAKAPVAVVVTEENTVTAEVQAIESAQAEVISADLMPEIAPEVATVAVPAAVKAVVKNTSKATTKVTLKDIRTLKKELKAAKALSPAKTKGNTDTLALLSLIFGGAGFLFLFIGGAFSLLLGIAGLVLGIIALKKGTSQRTMAILGIVFGGLVALLALLVISVLATAGVFI